MTHTTTQPPLDMAARIGRLDLFRAEGRLLRHKWTGTDAQGRETACLLAALSPEVAKSERAGDCPAEVMPAWLAHMTQWIDDAVSDAAWPDIIKRYGGLARRWHVLSPEAWRRAEYGARVAAVREAMRHTTDAAVLAACEGVLRVIEPVARGQPLDEEARQAAAAAEAAAAAAAEAARWAAAAARWAADRLVTAILDIIEAEIAGATT